MFERTHYILYLQRYLYKNKNFAYFGTGFLRKRVIQFVQSQT